jgi:hypothetical protein
MPTGKKKATFYLPEDLLRATRVFAARRDKRESQVVEEALRALLGYGEADERWSRALAPEPADAGVAPPAPREDAPAAPSSPPPRDASADAAEGEAPAPFEPEALHDLLEPGEAVEVAVAELHALREEHADRP